MAQAKSSDNSVLYLVIGGLFVFNKVFGKSEEDKKGDKETTKIEDSPLVDNPFAVGVFKVPIKKGLFRFTLTIKQATKAASLINDGLGLMSDDEAQIMAGIKYAKVKADITMISTVYTRLYNHDLYTDLKKNLDRSAELGNLVNSYINKLPLYSKKGTLK